MSRTFSTVRIGARRSSLSQRQVELVRDSLHTANPDLIVETVLFTTIGDRQLDTPLPEIGGKGVFTAEIEEALLRGEIDLAVHSLKDLPVENPAGIVIGAVMPRADLTDALISRSGLALADLPHGAIVGTSSHRRAAQLLRVRPDLRPTSIRGNVETRLRKCLDPDSEFEAIVLAWAGLERLGLLDPTMHELPLDVMLPAPGQAALAVQCREEPESRVLANAINHRPSELAVLAERSFLTSLGGGCSAPVAAAASWTGDQLHLRGRVLSLDGQSVVNVESNSQVTDHDQAVSAGHDLAQEAVAMGAIDLLEAIRV